MDLPHYTPRFGFWIATTCVIIIVVFAVVLAGLALTSQSVFVAYLSLTLELAFVCGSCLGLLQSFMMPYPSSLARWRWFWITVMATIVGWCTMFAIQVLLGLLPQTSTNMSNQLISAIFEGFVNGALIGANIGQVTGIIQGRFQRSSARQWLVGNLISWSIGIGVPLAVLFAAISQIRLFI